MNQQMIINMLLQRVTKGNPAVINAVNMFRSGNSSGVEQIARNMCKTNGSNPDEVLRTVQNMFRF